MPHWESAASQPREITDLTDKDLAELAEWAVAQALRKERRVPQAPRFGIVFRVVAYAFVSTLLLVIALLVLLAILNAIGFLSALAAVVGAK